MKVLGIRAEYVVMFLLGFQGGIFVSIAVIALFGGC